MSMHVNTNVYISVSKCQCGLMSGLHVNVIVALLVHTRWEHHLFCACFMLFSEYNDICCDCFICLSGLTISEFIILCVVAFRVGNHQ